MVTRYTRRITDVLGFVAPEVQRSPQLRSAVISALLVALGPRKREAPLLAAAAGLLAYDSAQQEMATRRAVNNAADVSALTSWLPDHGMEFGGYAVDADLASVLRSNVRHAGSRSIVEFGAGLSTLTIALALRELDDGGTILSFEASGHFVAQVTELLARSGLSEYARVVHAPLELRRVQDREVRWHDPELVASEAPPNIDLLFVDGPVSVNSWSRWPAVEVLWGYLTTGSIVLLDDGGRRRERQCAMRWAKSHAELQLSWIDTVTGVWVAEVRDSPREQGTSRSLHTVLRTVNPRPAGWGKSAVRRL